jgi:hypothetical protein
MYNIADVVEWIDNVYDVKLLRFIKLKIDMT